MEWLLVLLSSIALPAPNVSQQARSARDLDAVHHIAFDNPGLLGLERGDELTEASWIDVGRGAIVKARRRHRGFPVVGESIKVRIDSEGSPMRVRGAQAALVDLQPVTFARGAAIQRAAALLGINVDAATAVSSSWPTALVVSAKHRRFAYAVLLPSLSPLHTRVALIDAHDGSLLSVRRSVRSLSLPATAYDPHPLSNDLLEAPSSVVLDRLVEISPQTLRGEQVQAYSCMTDDETVRIKTCEDVLGAFLCALAPAEYRDVIVAFCGEGQRAVASGTDGYLDEPRDDLHDYTLTSWPFDDEFAEVHAYYHVSKALDWFGALGNTLTSFELPVMANVSMPSAELLGCATEAWSAETDRTSARARQIISECTTTGPRYLPVDNAFFLGGELEDMLGVPSGIYLGQGSTADFAYDGDIIYHELGHALATALGALTDGTRLDLIGIDDAPGSLGEAFSDYFAAALTDDPVIGGFVGMRLGRDSGIRTLEHELVCPAYLTGEVHDDSRAFAAALWDARALYPQTERDSTSGDEVRVFDRVVWRALAMLSTDASFADAAAEVLAEVKSEPALEDPDAAIAGCVLAARNVAACERIRVLCSGQPVEELMLTGAGSETSAVLGGTIYAPFAPGPVQLRIPLAAGTAEAQLSASLSTALGSAEDLPDFLGISDTEPTWDVRLLWRADAPVEMSYTGSGSFEVSAVSDGEVAWVGTGADVSASITVPAGTEDLFLAVANYSAGSATLRDITVISGAAGCPAPAAAPSSVDCSRKATIPDSPGGEDGGCDCTATKPSELALLCVALFLFGLRRVTRRGRWDR